MICSQPDYEFGLQLYMESVVSGNMGPESAKVYAYGLYLMGGGTPDGFEQFTDFDMQVLISTADCIKRRECNELLEGICKMFGGETED